MRSLKESVLCTAAVCVLGAAPGAAQQTPYTLTTVYEGLERPGSFAILPDGSMLVTERAGLVRLVRGGVLQQEPVAEVPRVHFAGQGGLLDIVAAPDFATSRSVYLSYSWGDEQASALRVLRGRFDAGRLADLKEIFTASPLSDRPNHYGGRMAFLPDGTMLVTLGDRWTDRAGAQRLDTHIGKIVRLNLDGSVPADNPFVGRPNALPEIWSVGHRISQGIGVDGSTGRVYSVESGPWGGDEFNVVEAGGNYGWPVITNGKDYNGAQISPFTEYEGMQPPKISWTPEVTPYGLAFYDANLFDAWRGDVLVSGYYGDLIRVRETSPGVFEEQERLLEASGAHSFRDARVGPDGALYLLVDGAQDGRILRLSPQ